MADSRYPKIIEGETGPNGHPVGYDDNGDYVEWMPDEDGENGDEPWALILRRNDDDVAQEHRRLWDKVWYTRHVMMPDPLNECWQQGEDVARALEDRYGKEFLDPGSDADQDITLGKFKALGWVLGEEWDRAGDT